LTLIVIGFSVLPLLHLTNLKYLLGEADTETVVPLSYCPPLEFTLPPSLAVTVKVYFTIGVGGGVTGSESFEHPAIARKSKIKNLFIIIELN